jgi:oligosaccharide repeat unit polymerase
VLSVTGYILVPFVGVVVFYNAFRQFSLLAFSSTKTTGEVDFKLLEQRLKVWFRAWLVISLIEIAVSGGLPLVWLVANSSKTYVDFGIQSLHGLVNSLLYSIALCHFALYLIKGQRRHLRIPVFAIVWSVLLITRALMLVALLEFAIAYLRLKRVRPATLIRIMFGTAFFILVFGFVGDLRSGSEAFRWVAQPTSEYPEWLPSGVLWVYIYVTTPINNLIYTMHSFRPVNSLLFPNSAATLFPTVIRTIIYGSQVGQASSGNLVDESFNISTAYVGPFQDYGLVGVVLFSVAIALICQYFWFRDNLRDVLIFCVLTQCLLISLFFNNFFALPVITQIVWLYYFFLPRLRIGATVSRPKNAGSANLPVG